MLVSIFFQSLLWSVQVVGPNVSEPNILEPQLQNQNQNQNQNQTQSWIIELREKSILEKNLQNKKEGRTLENPKPLKNQLRQSQSQFIARMKNRIGPVMIKRKFHRALNAIVVGYLSPKAMTTSNPHAPNQRSGRTHCENSAHGRRHSHRHHRHRHRLSSPQPRRLFGPSLQSQRRLEFR